MSDASPATVQKIQSLAQIAADLRQGKHFEITCLTLLKSLCSDPKAAAQFALYLAKKTQQAMKAPKHSGRPPSKTQQRYRRLVAKAVRGMTGYLKKRTKRAESSLYELLSEIRDSQNQYERQRWGTVRIIHSREVLLAELALECVLSPWHSSILGYQLARHYAERYNPRHGTGRIPESGPMVEDITEFWGRHFLGRGWKKRAVSNRAHHTPLLARLRRPRPTPPWRSVDATRRRLFSARSRRLGRRVPPTSNCPDQAKPLMGGRAVPRTVVFQEVRRISAWLMS